MSTGTIDDKWRLTIPKEVRKVMHLSPRTPVDIRLGKESFVIRPLHRKTAIRKTDSLTWLLHHPSRIDLRKLKQIDLEKVEEEMWLP